MTKTPLHVYLSPHLDDAALSCGATIAQQVDRAGSAHVLTIFAGRPGRFGLSAYARQLHEAAGVQTDLLDARRAEDERACQMLGATCFHLEYLDAPYRTDPTGETFLYTSDDELMGWRVHALDLPLSSEMAAAMAKRYGDEENPHFYAPLGAGGHVDHLIVRSAAQQLEDAGFPVDFYEDYPYAEEGHRLVRALALPVNGGWHSQRVLVDGRDVQRKCEAIACYRSQVPLLFGDAEVMRRRVSSYMELAGEGEGYAERYWRR